MFDPAQLRPDDGADPGNQILARIPSAEREAIVELAEEVVFPGRHGLFDQGDQIDRVYFPLTGMVSLVIVLRNGATVEAMTAGREGFIGVPLLHRVTTAGFKGICQVEGKFLELPADAFLSTIVRLPELTRRLLRYAQFSSEVLGQSAACNGMHSLQQRCARWLLVTSDAICATNFTLTQEFLAQMLAVRRSGVTVTMAALAKRELVSYKYRQVSILDVAGLRNVACECYGTIKSKAADLLA